MSATRGTEFLLDLPEAVVLRGGDALILEDGRLIEIVAAPEELAEVRCGDPRQLARVAYHIGNRHVQAEILDNRLRMRRDHVLEDMVRGLGAKVSHIEAPFEPDTGAYEPVAEAKHAHNHAHKDHAHHGHEHHDHKGHDHAAHAHGHEHGAHEHGDDCGCDHEHGHKDHKHGDKPAHAHDHAHGAHGHKHD